MNPSELRITSIRQGRRYQISITHIPTGITVSSEGEGYLKTRELVMTTLEEKVNDTVKH